MSEFLKPCSRLLFAHEQGFTSDALWCGRPGEALLMREQQT